jgi:hypothetical protein
VSFEHQATPFLANAQLSVLKKIESLEDSRLEKCRKSHGGVPLRSAIVETLAGNGAELGMFDDAKPS